MEYTKAIFSHNIVFVIIASAECVFFLQVLRLPTFSQRHIFTLPILFCYSKKPATTCHMRQANSERSSILHITVHSAAHVPFPHCSGGVAACCQSATCTCCCNALTLDCHSLATKYEHDTQTDMLPNLAYWPSGSELPYMRDEYHVTQQCQCLRQQYLMPQKMLIIFCWISC